MLAIFAVASLQAAERGAAVRLASDGKAASAIVVPAGASSDTLRAAGECADGLRRITGADFTVTPGPANGIVVGTAEEWGVPFPRDVSLSPVLQRDDYIIRTEGGKLWLLGQSPVGVRNAVWDLFHRLGMRQFFPGSKWEVWPRTPKLEFGADLVARPAFYARQLRRGDGWPETEADYDRWLIRNRMMSGFVLNTSHVYDSFIASYPAFFKAHPEAITNNGGDARVKQGVGRLQTKLDVTVPGVLELLAADALAQLKADPALDSIRMDPSDGGGWRTDSPLGSPSNQALTAANHVARAIKPTHPGLKVGMYAYGWHSPPPTIKVEPNVIVSVATAFLRDGHTVESLLKGWHERGAEMGIREYLSCWPWDYDLPGLSHAADLPYVRNGLVRFHALGARYWTSTTSNGWGPHGLGFYYASRVLWSLDRAESVAEIKRDFFEKAFGPVSAAMQTFFEKYILTEGHPLLSEDLVGRMYRGLRETLDHPQPEDVRARVFELVRYVRFVDLMFNYRSSRGDARPVAFLELARFAYRTRDSQIANSWGAVFRDREIDAKAPRIAEALKQFAAEPLLSDNDLEALLAARIRETRINDFEPRSFSSDLLPLPATETGPPGPGSGFRFKGDSTLYVYLEGQTRELRVTVTAGLVYRDRGPARLRLYSPEHVLVDEPVAAVEIPPDRAPHGVQLRSPYAGLHRLELEAGGDRTQLSWTQGQKIVWPAAPGSKAITEGTVEAFFYVPRGVTIVGVYSASPKGRILAPDGTVAIDFTKMKVSGSVSTPVPAGTDGQCWRLVGAEGEKILLTVPPYLARERSEMLVPREVLANH